MEDNMKPNLTPYEDEECKVLVQYLELLQKQGHDILFSHIAQETYTKSWKQKNRNKAVGVRPGLPDYVIIINECLIFLEMKRKKGGTLSKAQKLWFLALRNTGASVYVAKGFDEAKDLIDSFLVKKRR